MVKTTGCEIAVVGVRLSFQILNFLRHKEHPVSNSLFITFEGGEGCGKSTQIAILASKLKEMGRDVVSLREPGGTKAGDMIRSILLSDETGALDPITELLLFTAARREIVTTVIKPALDSEAVVLCDRFADSTLAYQGYGRGVDKAFIANCAATACGDVWPDRTIFFDLPPEKGLLRAGARLTEDQSGEGRFEEEALEFHKKVRDGFMKIAEDNPGRVKTVDARGAIEDVAAKVFEAVSDIL